ncbi:MAG: DUF362 domain-containing protein [Ruminococcaceae bacterium]|nr:DUF362 domain-containing protein [Oscillospiraceae bacterium]
MRYDVSLVRCESYEEPRVRAALIEALDAIDGLAFLEKGMTVAIKTNLVSAMAPESAATTHPTMLGELVKLLFERGAGEVIVGDSPGGLYNAAFVGRVYKVTGMRELEKLGARLNDDFSQKEADYPEGKVLHHFTYTAYLDKADAIIDFCKLKTHGMMGMSGAAKNMFGCIPGVIKPEYHYRFPKHDDFARMIVDLDCFFKIKLCICDAVVGMEGNGPTMGTPRQIGAVLASASPHKLDLAAASLIGLTKADVPTLEAAYERELIPADVSELSVYGDPQAFLVSDFKTIPVHGSLEFKKESSNFFGKIIKVFLSSALRSRPTVKKDECVGCEVCLKICPAKAIVMEKGKPVIDREACIRCFCCQEFCPKGAMKVKRTLISKLLTK